MHVGRPLQRCTYTFHNLFLQVSTDNRYQKTFLSFKRLKGCTSTGTATADATTTAATTTTTSY